MANAPNPPLPSPTPFWGLGFRFEVIANHFDNTYQTIRDVWLIGVYLAWPFYLISYAFYGARNLSWEADSLIKDIKGWVDGIISGSTFAELFYNLAYHTWQLIRDPRGWTIDRLRDVSGDFFSIYINARAWIEAKIIDSFPFMSSLRFNPQGWLISLISTTFGSGLDILFNPQSYILSKVEDAYPFILQLLFNPVGYVATLLIQRYPQIPDFFSNPSGRVVQWLNEAYPQLGDFFRNPVPWVEDKILTAVGVDYDYSLGFTLSFVRGIILALSTSYGLARGRITTLICDLILTFI